MATSRAASTGSAVPAQIWPCGCGFEAPIAAPRFSKTWTQRYVAPSSVVWSAHTSMTRRIASGAMRAERQVVAGREADDPADPALALGTEEPVAPRSPSDVSGRSAAKSLVKTNVVP